MQLGNVSCDEPLLLKIMWCVFNYEIFGEWRSFASLWLQMSGGGFTLDVAFLSLANQGWISFSATKNLLSVKIQLFTMSRRQQSNNKEQDTNRGKCGNFHHRDRFPWTTEDMICGRLKKIRWEASQKLSTCVLEELKLPLSPFFSPHPPSPLYFIRV